MKYAIDPGKERCTLMFNDNIVFSHVKNLKGEPMELKLSLMFQAPRRQVSLAELSEGKAPKEALRPALLWVNGGGWRGLDKNALSPELREFADAGYIVACMYYRSSAEGHFPDQLIDVKTAIRFLRANAEKYGIDPERIGVFGRSAGGHLSSFCAMNTDGFDSEEWSGVSSQVQACCDMFGPIDLEELALLDVEKVKDPSYRWHTLSETHEGALLGGDEATMVERAKAASPINYINDKLCPMLIMHGDCDPLVNISQSEKFYDKLVAEGHGDKVDFVTVKNGGHGSDEFYQAETKKVMTDFFDKYLK